MKNPDKVTSSGYSQRTLPRSVNVLRGQRDTWSQGAISFVLTFRHPRKESPILVALLAKLSDNKRLRLSVTRKGKGNCNPGPLRAVYFSRTVIKPSPSESSEINQPIEYLSLAPILRNSLAHIETFVVCLSFARTLRSRHVTLERVSPKMGRLPLWRRERRRGVGRKATRQARYSSATTFLAALGPDSGASTCASRHVTL